MIKYLDKGAFSYQKLKVSQMKDMLIGIIIMNKNTIEGSDKFE